MMSYFILSRASKRTGVVPNKQARNSVIQNSGKRSYPIGWD